MLSAEEQLEHIEHRLLQTGGSPLGDALCELDERDLEGRLRLLLEYPSGHHLHVSLGLTVAYGYPLWTDYRFHLQDRHRRCVFRYDNSPHYPRMPTFPHHKHTGLSEQAVEHPLPTLSAIITEVEECVSGSPPVAKAD